MAGSVGITFGSGSSQLDHVVLVNAREGLTRVSLLSYPSSTDTNAAAEATDGKCSLARTPRMMMMSQMIALTTLAMDSEFVQTKLVSKKAVSA